MNEETMKLREHELERMAAQYYCERREQATERELARLRALPFGQLPCGEEEKKELYDIATERLSELEKEIPAFEGYCERMRKREWPRNLYEEIFHEPLLLKEGAEEKMRCNVNSLSPMERDCLLKLFCEKKSCDEICKELQIYPTELEKHITWGLLHLRHPRYNRNIRQYLVLLDEDASLSEVAAACKSEEELLYALGQAPILTSKSRIPAHLMSEALTLVRAHPEAKITAAFLQKNLHIPYPEAADLRRLLCFGPQGVAENIEACDENQSK